MKNKYVFMITGIIGISLLLSACNKTDAAVDKPTQDNNETQSQQAANQQGSNGQNNNGRQEFQRADISGRVKSIVGNEVVLELMEMPERGNGAQQGSTAQQTPERQASGGSGMPAGGMPAGGAAPGMQGPGGGGQQRTNRELNLTGETKTILIPVGVPIMTIGQNTQKELDLADIYQGMIMQIWLDQNDKEMITQVRVMQGR
ncbi:hypothetical protein [Geosporobacter ferrireducens]|uniref:Lipoprotein n=1 Tax=Geosporobacter ferrireducens TaxID=1424294 RepID=A0A1D8GFP9_9FIRM|nr:hypothetical protein [Geosporobacter ferrireducens]AOT69739.1 hypothetical protein Gferi_09170 [Geosporobacter ferrireducens]MTI54551.1 hypothetical protein [Geosporobacter ferrireducens]